MPKRITKGNLWGFIQSRPYASIADIRRLFSLEVEGASPVTTSEGTCYLGLPPSAAELIRQLWQEGRIVLDMNPDVKARVIQGVYPTRVPAARQGPAAGATSDGGPGGAGGAAGASEAGTPSSRRRRRRKKRPAGSGMARVEASSPIEA